MKVEQISEHIWSLKTWMLIPVHIWVVKDERGITLVDAGIPLMAKGILKTVQDLNAGSLARIVLTHGHSDHTGAINKVRQTSSIPVYAHSIEIPYLEGKLAYPRRKKATVTVVPGLTQPLPSSNQNQLSPIGGLKPYLTPGHSPGHVVYYHEKDQVLLAGDLFTSKNGTLKKPMPMFTANMEEALQSAEIVSQLNPKRLEVCHGNCVLNPGEQIEDYRKSN
ncbi:MBL fold metallo-hydrolase [Fictibacillus enclensis]|uniref:MBL fold metallo-hydrolase n=1 Tax=Fictibacillus enclensis TaxID=1017270 RepID=UPI0024C02D8B|nr:MBL fold metallo-hydrolase [Fictibacillus enclensis]MDM5339659.1 MBL fold metallo-hydrolase [Fictibacillus enclensis]WHY71114.1 MBL fold metallo-hydrolase [Fictibacillus enclensis]